LYPTDSHVLLVVEIRQIRQVVNAHPLYRFVVLYRRIYFLYLKGFRFDSRVAVHTDVRRRNVGILAFPYPGMAVVAVYLVLPCVDLMRECNWLGRLITLLHTYCK